MPGTLQRTLTVISAVAAAVAGAASFLAVTEPEQVAVVSIPVVAISEERVAALYQTGSRTTRRSHAVASRANSLPLLERAGVLGDAELTLVAVGRPDEVLLRLTGNDPERLRSAATSVAELVQTSKATSDLLGPLQESTELGTPELHPAVRPGPGAFAIVSGAASIAFLLSLLVLDATSGWSAGMARRQALVIACRRAFGVQA